MTSAHRVTTVGIVSAIVCLMWAACFAGVARASVDYMSASFVDRSHGWIAGIDNQTYNTEVWRSIDGGQSWTKVGSAIAAGAGVAWVTFVSPSTGVWGNGSVWRTTDGGDTWQPAPTSSGIFNEASFATASLGWAGCSYGTSESGGGIAVTTDGGATWTRQLNRPGPDGSGGFSRVSSPTKLRCYVLKWGRSGGVWATSNGGAAWTRRVLPSIPGSFKFYHDLDFPAGKIGWAVGDSGRIARTTNGGVTWTKQRSGVKSALVAADFVDTRTGFVVGNGGCVLRTRDGGAHWVKLSSGTGKGLTAVCFVDRSRGWTVGSKGALLRTTNGGKSWRGQH